MDKIDSIPLELAHAQFIGFHHGRWSNNDIVGLVTAMGLTKDEWLKWKSDYATTDLTEADIQEVDEHFKLLPDNRN